MSTKMTESDWAVALEVFRASLPRRGDKGRDDRLFLEAMHYFSVHNISWRALPHDFPPWESVYDHFRRWKKSSTLERIHDVLREETRTKQRRSRSPSAAVLDSQSVKTGGKRGTPTATTPARKSPAASATFW